MNHAIAISNKKAFPKEKSHEKKRGNLLNKLGKSASFILIASMFAVGSMIALISDIPIKNVMNRYSYDVLVILIIMELFTNLIADL